MSDVVPGNRGGGEGREDVDPDVSLITDFQVITDIRVSECASVQLLKNSQEILTSLGTEGIDQPEKAHRGDRTRRHTRKVVPTALPAFQGSLLLAFDPTASGNRPAIVYCSHGVSEEHRKRQKGSGELDLLPTEHNCILR